MTDIAVGIVLTEDGDPAPLLDVAALTDEQTVLLGFTGDAVKGMAAMAEDLGHPLAEVIQRALLMFDEARRLARDEVLMVRRAPDGLQRRVAPGSDLTAHRARIEEAEAMLLGESGPEAVQATLSHLRGMRAQAAETARPLDALVLSVGLAAIELNSAFADAIGEHREHRGADADDVDRDLYRAVGWKD